MCVSYFCDERKCQIKHKWNVLLKALCKYAVPGSFWSWSNFSYYYFCFCLLLLFLPCLSTRNFSHFSHFFLVQFAVVTVALTSSFKPSSSCWWCTTNVQHFLCHLYISAYLYKTYILMCIYPIYIHTNAFTLNVKFQWNFKVNEECYIKANTCLKYSSTLCCCTKRNVSRIVG